MCEGGTMATDKRKRGTWALRAGWRVGTRNTSRDKASSQQQWPPSDWDEDALSLPHVIKWCDEDVQEMHRRLARTTVCHATKTYTNSHIDLDALQPRFCPLLWK